MSLSKAKLTPRLLSCHQQMNPGLVGFSSLAVTAELKNIEPQWKKYVEETPTSTKIPFRHVERAVRPQGSGDTEMYLLVEIPERNDRGERGNFIIYP